MLVFLTSVFLDCFPTPSQRGNRSHLLELSFSLGQLHSLDGTKSSIRVRTPEMSAGVVSSTGQHKSPWRPYLPSLCCHGEQGLFELQTWIVEPVSSFWSWRSVVYSPSSGEHLLLTSHQPGLHVVVYHQKSLIGDKAVDIQPQSPFPLRPGFSMAACCSKLQEDLMCHP